MSTINDFFTSTEEDELISKLKTYDEAYYIEGNEALLSDSEYDEFKEYVRSKYPENPYFQNVGFSVKGKKVKHEYVLGSLTKFKVDTIDKWLSKFNPHDEIVITPKFDGLTVYCCYNNDKLKLATTRGDGIEGSDITKKVEFFYPQNEKMSSIKVRGEVLLPGDLYLKLGKANRRNSASGILGRDDFSKDLHHLNIVFYELIEAPVPIETEKERLEYINDCFPNNYLFFDVVKVKDVDAEYLKTKLFEYRNKLIDYCDIDGIVLTLNNSVRENEKYPKNKVAFKFGDEEAIGEIAKINWETSRNGRVVPVIELKNPVNLCGADILRATAYNAKYVVDNDLKEGKKIRIVRSGGVIPKIIGTI